MADILFKTDDFIFSYRVGGVLIHDGKVLMQNANGDDGYAFVGGHVSFGETTDQTLIREFKEEIGADVKIERLLMVNENFFPWGGKPCQQINLYYLVSLKDKSQIPLDRNFNALDELGNERIELNMCWIPLDKISDTKIYPSEAKKHIINLPDHIVHFSSK
jgi:8-oxo-dGTP pyrophosphatase MutT (NUDIX family)